MNTGNRDDEDAPSASCAAGNQARKFYAAASPIFLETCSIHIISAGFGAVPLRQLLLREGLYRFDSRPADH